jgi:hypothetical protein
MPTAGLSILPTFIELAESHIFPKHFEFVGIDVCLDGNCPAMSKHQLLQIGLNLKQSAMWPKSSGLLKSTANSYHILSFELLLFAHSPQNLNTPKSLHPTGQLQLRQPFDNIKQAILSNPCLKRFNHQRLIVLRTDFSSQGLATLSVNLATMMRQLQ